MSPLTSNAFLQAISAEGVCWRSNWALLYESGLSRLWKLVFTNALTPPQLGRLVGLRLLQSDDSAGLHGRSFLSPMPISPKPSKPSYFAEVLGESLLTELPQTLRMSISSDVHIRYCPVCLAQGYHSEFFQLDGLARCPIHDQPLLNQCRNCRRPTNRYAMTRTNVLSPFRCSGCDRPLGDDAPRSPIDFAMNIDTTALAPIASFLEMVQGIQLEWPTNEQWQYGHRWAQGDGSSQRIHTLTVLRTLVPVSLPESLFDNPVVHIDRGDSLAEDVPEDRYAIYVRYREFLRQALTLHYLEGDAETHQALEFKDDIMYPDRPVCPYWFAFHLWKFHFEQRYAPQQLRPLIKAWPLEATVSNTLWVKFCEWAFLAYVDVALAWCEKVEPDGRGGITRESLLAAMETLRIELMPDWRAWPTALSFLRLTPPGDHEASDVLVSVSSNDSLTDLLESHCHGNCSH